MKAIDPRTLSTKDYTERVVVFVKKFEVLDQAPRELHMMYKPVTGEIYKALKDTGTGIYYLDIPETLDRDGGGWAFTDLTPKDEQEELDFEFVIITKANASDINLDIERIVKLADWLDEAPLLFSWEQEKGVVFDEDEIDTLVPHSKEEWERVLKSESHEDGLNNALDMLHDINPRLYSSLSLVIIMFALQEQGLLPRVGNNDDMLLNKHNSFGIPLSISALLDSHVNRPTIPNMVGTTRLALFEITRLIEAGMEGFFENIQKVNKKD